MYRIKGDTGFTSHNQLSGQLSSTQHIINELAKHSVSIKDINKLRDFLKTQSFDNEKLIDDISNTNQSLIKGVVPTYLFNLLQEIIVQNNTKTLQCEHMPSQYRPSYSSGFYGSFTIGYHQNHYMYYPSLNCGIYGAWIYNDQSKITTMSHKQKAKISRRENRKQIRKKNDKQVFYANEKSVTFECFKCKGFRFCVICRNKPCNICKGSGEWKKRDECSKCKGTGTFKKDGIKCAGCSGSGTFTMKGACRSCKGTGRYKTYGSCKKCGGNGRFEKNAPCKRCCGQGILDKSWRCDKCNGGGNILKRGRCRKCGGSGKYESSCLICNQSGKCMACKGRGRVNIYQKLGIRIPHHYDRKINKHHTGINDWKFITFQLYEIIMENQQSSLINKLILNPINLERFINFLSPTSCTYFCKEIDFKRLKQLKLSLVGLFGSRSEVISMLKIYTSISNGLISKLSWLKPGIHAILPVNIRKHSKMDRKRTMFIFYWPSSKSFNMMQSNIARAMKKDPSCLIARIMHELCCTVCISLKDNELNKFFQHKNQLKIVYGSESFLWSPPKQNVKKAGDWEENYEYLLNIIHKRYKLNKQDIELQDSDQCDIDCGEELMILWQEMIDDDHIIIMNLYIMNHESNQQQTRPVINNRNKTNKFNFVIQEPTDNFIKCSTAKSKVIKLKLYSDAYRSNAIYSFLLNGNTMSGMYQLYASSSSKKRYSTSKAKNQYNIEFTSMDVPDIQHDIRMSTMKNMSYKIGVDDKIIFNEQMKNGDIIMFISSNHKKSQIPMTNIIASSSHLLKPNDFIYCIQNGRVKLVSYYEKQNLFAILYDDKFVFAIFKEQKKMLFTNKKCTVMNNFTAMFFDEKDGNLFLWLVDDNNIVHAFNYDINGWDKSKEFELDQSYNHYLLSPNGSFLIAFKQHINDRNYDNNDCYDEKQKSPSIYLSDTDSDDQSDTVSVTASIKSINTENDEKQSEQIELHSFVLYEGTKMNYDLNDYTILPQIFSVQNMSLKSLKIKCTKKKEVFVICGITNDSKLIYHPLDIQSSDAKLTIHRYKTTEHSNNTNQMTKLSYLNYMLQKFGSRAAMIYPSKQKLSFHTTFIMQSFHPNAVSLCKQISPSIFSSLYDKEKKNFTYLDWKCNVFTKPKYCTLYNTINKIKNREITTDIFIQTVIEQIPTQIARTNNNRFVPMFNGEDDQRRYQNISSSLEKTISFGAYDALISSWKGSIKIITSMGKQSTGKSYLLNHLFGSKFDISGGRCTDGAWLTTKRINNILYIIMDFEGLGSFERTSYEDTLLAIFNAAISNCTLFKCENRFDRSIKDAFYSFQNGAQIMSGSNNCFKGELVLILKDVIESGAVAAEDDFCQHIERLAMQSELIINENGKKESTFFVHKMYKNGLSILPYPPLSNEKFFTELNVSIQPIINDINVIYYDGKRLLNQIKKIMSKLTVEDWSALSNDDGNKAEIQAIKNNLESAIKSGCNDDGKPLLNMDNNIIRVSINECIKKTKNYHKMMKEYKHFDPNIEQILIGIINNVNDRGLTLDKYESFIFLWKRFNDKIKRIHDNFKQFTDLFQVFLDIVYWRRCLIVNQYIKENTQQFCTQNSNNKMEIESLYRFATVTLNNTIRDKMRLCRNKCNKCFFICLLFRNHANEHDCLYGDDTHQCQMNCHHCVERGDVTPCDYKCGHDKHHNCRRMHSVQ